MTVGNNGRSLALWTLLLQMWGRLPLPRSVRYGITRFLSRKYLVGVAAIVLDETGHILLCYHTYRASHPWGLPGGGLNRGEPAAQAAEREVWEETGFKVTAEHLLLVRNDRIISHVGFVFLCHNHGGSFKPNPEISRIQYFPLDALPERLRPTDRKVIQQIRPLLSQTDPVTLFA